MRKAKQNIKNLKTMKI